LDDSAYSPTSKPLKQDKSLMQMINPEVSVIQKIYKVILNRHELLSTRKNFAYTRLKQHH
jgi:hypothetical protein